MKAGSACALAVCAVFSACTFDYGNTQPDNSRPDIVMRDVEYVRVRSGDPLVRFQAEYAERYEAQKIMDLKEFSFEQFENHGGEINATGNAGEARVELDSGNIDLAGGVRIAVETEDIIIETDSLNWKDREKQLTGNSDDEVAISRSDGTGFTGRGFSADARVRTWAFESGAQGSYVETEDEAETTEGEPELSSTAADAAAAADISANAPDPETSPEADISANPDVPE